MTVTDSSQYKILALVHDRKYYSTVEEFKAAWRNGVMKKSIDEPYDWATRTMKGNKRDLDDREGPRTVQFDGARYRLDEKENYVTWMGWAFYLSFERDMGVHLWDMYVHPIGFLLTAETSEARGSSTSWRLKKPWHSIPDRIRIKPVQSGWIGHSEWDRRFERSYSDTIVLPMECCSTRLCMIKALRLDAMPSACLSGNQGDRYLVIRQWGKTRWAQSRGTSLS